MLEQQVRTLQSKVEELEQDRVMKSDLTSDREMPWKRQLRSETLEPTSWVTKQHPTEEEANKREPVAQQITNSEPVPKKPHKTFEQTITTILPKVFIVILVLGVLWGLKVASDYGILHDGLKIALGFIGSVALFVIAFWMERKQKGSMQVALMLYGGAFVVGILTTAAGAILYDVLGLYVALFITFLYISYGVAISYVKGTESLTALVVFTSFLLPYLLEYMAFNSFIIVAYVVLLFTVLQFVILKHRQKYALYVGAFLSSLALVILTVTVAEEHLIYPVAIAAVAAMFLIVMQKLFQTIVAKHRAIHAGFLFSLLMYFVLAMNIAASFNDIAAYVSLSLFVAACIGCAFVARKAGQQALFDVTLSAALIALLTMIFYFETGYAERLLLLFVTVSVGLLLANRLRALFMQAVYSVLFTIISLMIVVDGNIEPFWSVGHVTYVLVIVALVLLYRQLYKPLEEPSPFELVRQKLYVIEWIPVALYMVVLLYSMHFQNYYLPYYSMSYLALMLIAAAFVVMLFVLPTQKHVPLFIVSAFGFAMAYIILATNPIAPAGEAFVGVFIRLLYLILVSYALYNFLQGGLVREKLIQSPVDVAWMSAVIALLVGLFGVTNFITLNDLAPWNFKVVVNTVAIFALASISLFVGNKRDEAKIRLFGLSLLVVGIVKLIFFDLSSLDLIVRSVLFIIIGGAGLVLTNKLLAKKQ